MTFVIDRLLLLQVMDVKPQLMLRNILKLMDYRCLVDILLERQRVKELLSVYGITDICLKD